MDFEDAAVRLARDQSKMKGRGAAANRGLGERAKRQAAQQKRQQERLRQERERKKQIVQYQHQYIHSGSRALRTKLLGPMIPDSGTNSVVNINLNRNSNNTKSATRQPLLLQPTSIWGDGDKIALPPSVLETLTSTLNGDSSNDSASSSSSPWTFRIGIPNPNYTFPSSQLVKDMIPPQQATDRGDSYDDNDAMDEDDSDDDHDDDSEESNKWEAYLDELNHQYLAYTHCTVVEFTQEEGYVGIPQPIATALLDLCKSNHNRLSEKGQQNETTVQPIVGTTRTVDPASAMPVEGNPDDNDDNAMDTSTETDMKDGDTSNVPFTTVNDDEKTPGHLAWGAFDIPNVPLEITMVRLPKGRGTTLVPTKEAVQNNFYGLKDVKLVLEQSLIRTRATLSEGDVVSTWHRGVKFDLKVTKLIPTSFRAVLCINTDIEVDIGEAEMDEDENNKSTADSSPAKAKEEEPKGFRLGSGGSQSQQISATASSTKTDTSTKPAIDIQLPPEPPVDQKENVCTAQIRFSGGQGKRRFNIQEAKLRDLFGFASSLMNQDGTTFRLVTRFPRREWSVAASDGGLDGPTAQQTLAEVGIQQGQELFLCENI